MAPHSKHFSSGPALLLILSLGLAPAQALEFAGGTGEPDDPYQIATAGQLIGMGQDPGLYDRHFVLIADLDLDPNRPGGQVFSCSLIAPYGPAPRPGHSPVPKLPYGGFGGTFDGAGHVIRNLVIRAEDASVAGLFGHIWPAGQVRDLGLDGVDIRRSSLEGLGFTGGSLAAVNEGGTVLRCYACGRVAGPDRIGGPAAGWGGIQAFATPSEDEIGGLIGANSGLVNTCYALVDVSGTGAIGGLIGQNSLGLVYFSFSAGQVRGTGWPGGLVGRSETSTFSRAGETVQDDPGTAIRCFWDIEASGILDSAAGEGRTTTELMSRRTYVSWTHTGVWELYDGYTYPQFLWQPGPPAWGRGSPPYWVSTGQLGYGGGSGEPNDPYRIETAEQFLTIGCHPEDFNKSFVLTADLDFNDMDHSQALPIGFDRVSFNGSFDGGSHSVSNLEISQPRAIGVGVFGLVGDGSVAALSQEFHYEIRDNGSYSWGYSGNFDPVPTPASEITGLHLHGVNVVGRQYVGGLIGLGAANVTDCSVSGRVTGPSMVGGLIGRSLGGTLSGCRADVQVSGEFCVGGLVGRSDLALNALNCQAEGVVTGQLFTGGLIGYSLRDAISGCAALADVHGRHQTGGCLGSAGNSTITLSYSLGTVTGERFVGGFAGEAGTATISDSYCLAEVTGGDAVGGFAGHTGSKGRVNRCYAVSRVTAIDVGTPLQFVGGFAGFASKADSACVGDCPTAISACFWDAEVSGMTEALGNLPVDPGDVAGLTTAQMQTAAPFRAAGWDFEEVWMICEGRDYPRLRWEGVDCAAGVDLSSR